MTPVVATSTRAAMLFSFDAASIATAPPSPWPTTARRFLSTSWAAAQRADGGANVVRVVRKGGGLRPAAALADAAPVVSEHEEAAVGEGAGELAEDRNSRHRFIAVGQARPADENDRRQPPVVRNRRLRHGTGEREAVGGDADGLVTRNG